MVQRWTAEFCEREYNARAGIPDAPLILQAWSSRARVVRRNHAALLDLPYGQSPSERLDFFPAAHAHAPLLTFIHGGYWRSLDKSDVSWIAPAFVRAGISVALINYALIPSISLPDLVRQVLRAHAWLYRRADALEIDPTRIVAAGHSAGGHLAAMMLAARWATWESDLPDHLVSRAISLSGLFDLEPLRHAPFIRDDLCLDAPSANACSPAHIADPGYGRLLAAVGANESREFKRQNALLVPAWPRVRHQTMEVPACHHLAICEALADPANTLHREAVGFILAD